MDTNKQQNLECFIVFTKSQYKHWVMGLLHKDLSHVYAMIKSDGGQFWQVINPLATHLDISIETVDEYPHPRVYAGYDAVILPVTAKITLDEARWSFCIFNCVEVIKGLLGIKSFWTWTPWQLYKLLTREERVGCNV